jgi:hypothetical protein
MIPGKNATGKTITMDDAFELLGPPDLEKTSSSSVRWIYFYDRFGKKDWFVSVSFSQDDPYASFGYNASSTLNPADWNKFSQGINQLNANED